MDLENEIKILRKTFAERSTDCVNLLKEVYITNTGFSYFQFCTCFTWSRYLDIQGWSHEAYIAQYVKCLECSVCLNWWIQKQRWNIKNRPHQPVFMYKRAIQYLTGMIFRHIISVGLKCYGNNKQASWTFNWNKWKFLSISDTVCFCLCQRPCHGRLMLNIKYIDASYGAT